jgi:hypothetical protein
MLDVLDRQTLTEKCASEDHDEDAALLAALDRIDKPAVDLFKQIRKIDALLVVATGRNAGRLEQKDPVVARIETAIPWPCPASCPRRWRSFF